MTVSHGERAAVGDPGAAAIGVHVAERQHAGAGLGQAASATDLVGDHDVVTAIENQCGVVAYAAVAQLAAGPPVTNLERAGTDDCLPCIDVAGDKYQRAGAGLGQAATATDSVADRDAV